MSCQKILERQGLPVQCPESKKKTGIATDYITSKAKRLTIPFGLISSTRHWRVANLYRPNGQWSRWSSELQVDVDREPININTQPLVRVELSRVSWREIRELAARWTPVPERASVLAPDTSMYNLVHRRARLWKMIQVDPRLGGRYPATLTEWLWHAMQETDDKCNVGPCLQCWSTNVFLAMVSPGIWNTTGNPIPNILGTTGSTRGGG